jgi:hypothetical protein
MLEKALKTILLHSSSHKKRRKGAVAQSVEQKTENLRVGGSIPSHTTNKKHKALNISLFKAFLFLILKLLAIR